MALGFEDPKTNAPLSRVASPSLQGPSLGNVSSDATVAGQMDKILSSNSPLLQRAKTRAAQAANSRGLLNSSMGVQAGEEAVLTTAMPMAQQDASTYANQGLVNQGAQNQFSTAANKYNTDSAMSQQQFGQNFQLSDQQYGQQTGTGAYRGQGLIGANLQSQLALQKGQQDFSASEAALGRTQQTALQEGQQGFASGEAALGRTQQTALQEGQQDFASGEAALGRTQQTALQEGQQDFASGESALGRTQQTALQEGQQGFASGEAALGRTQQTALQEGQQDFASGEAALGRTQQTALQEGQQDFASGESELDRTQQVTLMRDAHKNAVSTAKTQQEYEQANLTLKNGLQEELLELGQDNDLELAKMNSDLATGKMSAEVYANTQGAYLSSVSELVRQTQITVGEIQMTEGISAADKKLMLADQATLLKAHMKQQKTLYEGAATWDQSWADMPSDNV